LGKLVDPAARNATAIASFQDLSELCQSEFDAKRPLHNEHSFDSALGIHSVTGLGSQSFGQNPELLVIPNRVRTYSSGLCQRAGQKARQFYFVGIMRSMNPGTSSKVKNYLQDYDFDKTTRFAYDGIL
jgi:hypothetical protein